MKVQELLALVGYKLSAACSTVPFVTDVVGRPDGEIVARIREFADSNQLPPPASAEAADEFEAAVGCPIPLLLRTIYCEVANGGFGIDSGIVSLTDTGKWYSDEESLLSLYRAVSTPPPDYEVNRPRHVVPLVTLDGRPGEVDHPAEVAPGADEYVVDDALARCDLPVAVVPGVLEQIGQIDQIECRGCQVRADRRFDPCRAFRPAGRPSDRRRTSRYGPPVHRHSRVEVWTPAPAHPRGRVGPPAGGTGSARGPRLLGLTYRHRPACELFLALLIPSVHQVSPVR
ncbi:hypothetical protein ACFW1A_04780 [Kitasatospora sp. NPDC058965]|uniref:hypothetical protein n=1 Tax=Kitasatospora sp. NPDC058965 TaxID=3346682 RepID=UPI0036D06144